MRWVVGAVVVLGLASPSAFAADFDILRGSEPVGPARYTNWSGFYVGGQGTYASGGSAEFRQGNGTADLLPASQHRCRTDFNISAWQVLGKSDSTTTGIWRIRRLQFSMGQPDSGRRGELHPFAQWFGSCDRYAGPGAWMRAARLEYLSRPPRNVVDHAERLRFAARTRRLCDGQFSALWLCRISPSVAPTSQKPRPFGQRVQASPGQVQAAVNEPR